MKYLNALQVLMPKVKAPLPAYVSLLLRSVIIVQLPPKGVWELENAIVCFQAKF